MFLRPLNPMGSTSYLLRPGKQDCSKPLFSWTSDPVSDLLLVARWPQMWCVFGIESGNEIADLIQEMDGIKLPAQKGNGLTEKGVVGQIHG